jgi:hypothetical protein
MEPRCDEIPELFEMRSAGRKITSGLRHGHEHSKDEAEFQTTPHSRQLEIDMYIATCMKRSLFFSFLCLHLTSALNTTTFSYPWNPPLPAETKCEQVMMEVCPHYKPECQGPHPPNPWQESNADVRRSLGNRLLSSLLFQQRIRIHVQNLGS